MGILVMESIDAALRSCWRLEITYKLSQTYGKLKI